MEDRYVSALKSIERQFRDEIHFMGNSQYRLEEMTRTIMNDTISDNDYLKLLEIYCKIFIKKKENQKIAYCILRMQQICEAKKIKYRQKYYKNVQFQNSMDPDTENFLKEEEPYLEKRREQAMVPLLAGSAFFYILILFLLVFGFHVRFWAGLVLSLILWGILTGYFYFYVTELIIQDQMERLMDSLDPVLIDFETARNSSSCKIFHKLKK